MLWQPRSALSAFLFLVKPHSEVVYALNTFLSRPFYFGYHKRVMSSVSPTAATPSTILIDDEDNNSQEQHRQQQKNVKKKTPKQQQQQQRRPYRPGFNSYLKVLLDRVTIQRLHQATLEIQRAITPRDDDNNNNNNKETTNNDDNSDTASQDDNVASPSLQIKPRSLTSLHLTLLFAGQVLGELPIDELTSWHAHVSQRLQQSGFYLYKKEDTTITKTTINDDNDRQATDEFSPDDYWMALDEFVTFPPKRHYLLVARFQASPAWQALFADLQQMTMDDQHDSWPALAAQCRSTHKGTTWIAHVTLANIVMRGTLKQRTNAHTRLQERLQAATLQYNNNNNNNNKTEPNISVEGIAMGGPIPTQPVEPPLSWDFVPRRKTNKQTNK